MGVNLSGLVQVACLFKSANLEDSLLLQTGNIRKVVGQDFPALHGVAPRRSEQDFMV